jgi:hypothetical protein
MPLLEYSSARWRLLREQCFARDGHRCMLCNADGPLECHHRTYERAGEELLSDLTTLCTPCHDVVTDHQRRLRYESRELLPVQDVPATPIIHVFPSSYGKALPGQEVAPLPASHTFHSSYQEVPLETIREVSPGQRTAALDAQWPTQRSTEPPCPSN